MVSLDKKSEALLRSMARQEFGGKKGAIASVVKTAIERLAEKNRKEQAIRHQLKLMKKGINMGLKSRKAYEKRSEIYD